VIEKALFISPILNIERLILDMMQWANVTEKELYNKKEIAYLNEWMKKVI
jgi:hypothetical protein